MKYYQQLYHTNRLEGGYWGSTHRIGFINLNVLASVNVDSMSWLTVLCLKPTTTRTDFSEIRIYVIMNISFKIAYVHWQKLHKPLSAEVLCAALAEPNFAKSSTRPRWYITKLLLFHEVNWIILLRLPHIIPWQWIYCMLSPTRVTFTLFCRLNYRFVNIFALSGFPWIQQTHVGSDM